MCRALRQLIFGPLLQQTTEDATNSLFQFWSLTVAPSGIKNGQNNSFDNLGSQKVDNYVLGKRSILK